MASTTNVQLVPGSGWTLVVTGPVANFFDIRHFPETVPVYYTVATSLPGSGVHGGLRDVFGEFWANGALASGTNIYARISNNSNDNVQISVYQN
jgi:hypothetical protein